MSILERPHTNDVRLGNVLVTRPVCRQVTTAPDDFDPFSYPSGRRPPEVSAVRKARRYRPTLADYADRYIALTERAIAVSAIMNHGLSFEDAVLSGVSLFGAE